MFNFYVMGSDIKQELPRPAPRISPLSSQSRLPLRFSDSRVEFFCTCSNFKKQIDWYMSSRINMEYFIYIVVIKKVKNCRIIIIFCCIKLNHHFLSEYCFFRWKLVQYMYVHASLNIYTSFFFLHSICIYCNVTKIQYTDKL